MLYKVKYINSKGKEVTLNLEAHSEGELIKHVKDLDGYYLSSKVVTPSVLKINKIKDKRIIMFCYQLSVMLGAGIDLLAALDIIQSKTNSRQERHLYRQLYESIQKGKSLSESLIQERNVFDQLLISMVKMGEQSGDLEGSLLTMNEHYTKNKKIKDKVRTASVYPLILLVISVIVVMLLVVFVLPGIMANFGSGDIPLATRLLLHFAHFLMDHWLVIILAIGLLFIGLKFLYDTPSIKTKIHHKLLYLPVVGKLMRTILSARLARSFASLYSHGISTLEMIELSSVTLNNLYFEKRLNTMIAEINYGMTISQSLETIIEFDPLLTSMIKVGEETGQLGDVLKQTADYFESESDRAITSMISMIEPSMIIVMGVVIAFVVISIIQPIFKMYETIG